jgi:flagellar hook-associated protein 3 FlgL
MRVSDQQVFGLVSGGLNRIQQQSLLTQTQLSTGKRINQPSDDPIDFGQVVSLKGSLSVAEQRIRNIQSGQARLATADSTLGQVSNLLSQAKELAVQAASETANADDRNNIAQSVRQIQQQLVTLANTQVNGQAIFAGTKTDQDPFVLGSNDTVTYQGNSTAQSVQVGDGENVQVTLSGDQVFSGPDTNIFGTLKNLLASLESNDTAGIQTGLGNLDQAITQIGDATGQVGALENRLDNTSQNLQQFQQVATSWLSQTQDADLTQTLTKFSQQQLAFQAAAQTASTIMNTSLLNFLQ